MTRVREARLFRVQEFGLACLSIVPRPLGGDALEDELRAIKTAGVHLLVSMLMPDEQAAMDLTLEAERCQALGIEYLSVPIADFGVPSDSVAFENAVVQVAQTLDRKSVV